MRCPDCDRKFRKTLIYGTPLTPRKVYYCRYCNKLYYIKVEVVDPLTCNKCKQPIMVDTGKCNFFGNGKATHKRCPKKKKKDDSNNKL